MLSFLAEVDKGRKNITLLTLSYLLLLYFIDEVGNL